MGDTKAETTKRMRKLVEAIEEVCKNELEGHSLKVISANTLTGPDTTFVGIYAHIDGNPRQVALITASMDPETEDILVTFSRENRSHRYDFKERRCHKVNDEHDDRFIDVRGADEEYYDQRLKEMPKEVLEKAIRVLDEYLTPCDKQDIRDAYKRRGRDIFVERHFTWGMGVRNHLRQQGLFDFVLPVGNWDDYYIQVIEIVCGLRENPLKQDQEGGNIHREGT